MNNTPNNFIARAIALSLENVQQGKGGPFGAVVVKDGQIIAEGANSVTATNDPSAHAEVVAIREACRKLKSFELKDCEIYTSSEPCPMCLGAIYWARPARVYFANSAAEAAKAGFDDAFIYEEIKRPFGERKIAMIQLAQDEAPAAFRVWQEQETKIRY
jgi:guanine deaminase